MSTVSRFHGFTVETDASTQFATIYGPDGRPVASLQRRRVYSDGPAWRVFLINVDRAAGGEVRDGFWTIGAALRATVARINVDARAAATPVEPARVPCPAPRFNLERNGPMVAAEMRGLATPDRFSVVALRHRGAAPVVHVHSTLKAAIRRAASLCFTHGPHGVRDAYALSIVRPDGHILSLVEARAL